MGKASLATNIAFNCAEEHLNWQRDGGEINFGVALAVFSHEMSAQIKSPRVPWRSMQAEIISESLRSGKLMSTREEFQNLSFASQKLADLALYIDTPALMIAALHTRARCLKRRYNIGEVVVDHLQLLQGSGRADEKQRQRLVSRYKLLMSECL